MQKRAILITGTPCVGKTTLARLLASQLDALCVNLTEFAVRENLVVGRDKDRDTAIIDEVAMKSKLREVIESSGEKDVVIDGHYAAIVVPKELVTHVFVLRRDPAELRELMEKEGFSTRKLWENLASEILDTCLFDALEAVDEGKVCELDVSRKRVTETVSEVLGVLNGGKKCEVGIVDWLGKLENEGQLDELLRV